MGLDVLEFVIAAEEVFHVKIPDRDAQAMTTARHLIDFFHRQLPKTVAPVCLSQRAFHRLRAVLWRYVGANREEIRLDTDLSTVLPSRNCRALWRAVGQDMGVGYNWPSLRWSGWFSGARRNPASRIIRHMIAYHPRVFAGPDELWTRPQIRSVVRYLIEDQFGVNLDQLTDDMDFNNDLGIY